MAYQYPQYVETEQRQESPDSSHVEATDDPATKQKQRQDSNKEYLLNLKKDLMMEEIREKKTKKILKKLQDPRIEERNQNSHTALISKVGPTSNSYGGNSGGGINMFQYMNTAGIMMQKQRKERDAGPASKLAGTATSKSYSALCAGNQVRRRK